jgi:hypothetical protein
MRRSTESPSTRLFLIILLECCVVFEAVAWDWALSTVQSLAPGIDYICERRTEPRAMEIHAVRIRPEAKAHFYTTPRAADWVPNKRETVRRTTREFLEALQNQGHNAVVAVNGDAFSPWPAPYNEEGPCNLAGLAVAEGIVVSPPANSPSFIEFEDGTLDMAVTTSKTPLEKVRTAVSGFSFCLKDGEPTGDTTTLHPRTAVGLSRDKRTVYWIVVDGRRHQSQGCTEYELGGFLREAGAWIGINMDGGGSSTLVAWQNDRNGRRRAVVLNQPVGNGFNWLEQPEPFEKILFRPTERANGNNLAVVLPPDAHEFAAEDVFSIGGFRQRTSICSHDAKVFQCSFRHFLDPHRLIVMTRLVYSLLGSGVYTHVPICLNGGLPCPNNAEECP